MAGVLVSRPVETNEGRHRFLETPVQKMTKMHQKNPNCITGCMRLAYEVIQG